MYVIILEYRLMPYHQGIYIKYKKIYNIKSTPFLMPIFDSQSRKRNSYAIRSNRVQQLNTFQITKIQKRKWFRPLLSKPLRNCSKLVESIWSFAKIFVEFCKAKLKARFKLSGFMLGNRLKCASLALAGWHADKK